MLTKLNMLLVQVNIYLSIVKCLWFRKIFLISMMILFIIIQAPHIIMITKIWMTTEIWLKAVISFQNGFIYSSVTCFPDTLLEANGLVD